MNIGKLWIAALLAIVPASASAQPLAASDVSVTASDDYASTAPGVPIESVDVFYDQLSPYGVWVDEPTIGHVFIPETEGYVPYTRGHWMYTDVGFVWVASDDWAAQTSHYGRWAYSQPFERWVWLPDTNWGPSWVEWRQSGDDFGWAPLAPEVVVNAGYSPPIEAWHYCGATHVLDENVARYYEPRERVVEIHRAARPIQHYATVSNVRVVVGPPAATLRQYKIAAKPVKVDVKVTGRVASATEAHAQVARAQARKPQIEQQNQRRLQANTKLAAVVAKHPAPAANRTEAKKPTPTPAANRTEEKKPTPNRTEEKKPTRTPNRTEEKKPTPNRTEEKKPTPTANRTEEKKPTPTPTRTEEKKPTPTPTRTEEKKPTPTPAPVRTEEKKPTPTPTRTEEKKPTPAPAPVRTEEKKPTPTPLRTEEKKPEPKAPDKREPERK